jgi:hypothetical protein
MDDSTKYINEVIPLIKRYLSSPESALLLNDLYDTNYVINKRPNINTPEQIVFGPTLWREEENSLPYTSTEILIDEFIRFDVYRITGMSMDKYFELTRYERLILNNKLLEQMEKLNNETDRIRRMTKELTEGFDG